MEHIINRFLPFIRAVALAAAEDDLEAYRDGLQDGYLSLLKAVKSFDPGKAGKSGGVTKFLSACVMARNAHRRDAERALQGESLLADMIKLPEDSDDTVEDVLPGEAEAFQEDDLFIDLKRQTIHFGFKMPVDPSAAAIRDGDPNTSAYIFAPTPLTWQSGETHLAPGSEPVVFPAHMKQLLPASRKPLVVDDDSIYHLLPLDERERVAAWMADDEPFEDELDSPALYQHCDPDNDREEIVTQAMLDADLDDPQCNPHLVTALPDRVQMQRELQALLKTLDRYQRVFANALLRGASVDAAYQAANATLGNTPIKVNGLRNGKLNTPSGLLTFMQAAAKSQCLQFNEGGKAVLVSFLKGQYADRPGAKLLAHRLDHA